MLFVFVVAVGAAAFVQVETENKKIPSRSTLTIPKAISQSECVKNTVFLFP